MFPVLPGVGLLELELAIAVFSPSYYAASVGDVVGQYGGQGLLHFLSVGMHEVVSPSPLFDPIIYQQRSLLAAYTFTEGEQPSFSHWLRWGKARRIVPSALFDEYYYLATNHDVAAAGVFGFEHFLLCGMRERRPPNSDFDVAACCDALAEAPFDRWSLVDAHVQLAKVVPDAGYRLVGTQVKKPFAAHGAHWLGQSLAWRWSTRAALAREARHDPFSRYFDGVDLDDSVALAWSKLRHLGWSQIEASISVESALADIRQCSLFNADFYGEQAKLSGQDLDPALHYLLVGEALGFRPSAEFDPSYYARRYPDVMQGPLVMMLHYEEYGRAERRCGYMPDRRRVNPLRFDARRENVILIVHEGSRTGAPILGWNVARHLTEMYNLFTIILFEGELVEDFVALSAETYGPFDRLQQEEVDFEIALAPLFAAREFRYAVLNSSETRRLGPVCARHFVPTIFLVHEFGSYIQFAPELRTAFDFAAEIVFPAETVARSAETLHLPLARRRTRIMPQGMSVIPKIDAPLEPDQAEALASVRERREAGTFIVLGMGSVIIRKGTDLFLAAAAAGQRHASGRRIHFMWVGHGYDPVRDMGYSGYLHEQIQRSALQNDVTFVDQVTDLEPIYEMADAFLLASRLDPLPNVSIDAACRGIPVVCFANASGMADLLLTDDRTASSVVPYADADGAGRLLVQLSMDENCRKDLAQATKELARATFDMKRYVDGLDVLGVAHAARSAMLRADAAVIEADDAFDADLFLGSQPVIEPRTLTIGRYLASRTALLARGNADVAPVDFDPSADVAVAPSRGPRRPAPGFHPGLWEAAHPQHENRGHDPFAQYVRAGRPAGPWQLPVLRPFRTDADADADAAPGTLRAVLHATIRDVASGIDLLDHLRVNVSLCDLLVSTETAADAFHMRRAGSVHHSGSVLVEGDATDVSCVLACLASRTDHDVVGIVAADGDDAAKVWQEFQWQALLGGRHAMYDRILHAFSCDTTLGAVFPAEPYLADADRSNVYLADAPIGGMLWIRRAVLEMLLGLLASDDGDREWTRLVPVACARAGLACAVAHVPGVLW